MHVKPGNIFFYNNRNTLKYNKNIYMHHTIIISLVLKLNPIVMPGNFSCLMIILQGHLNLFNSHVLSSHKIYFYEKIFFFLSNHE